jgi:hypothetical protein
MRRKTLRWSSCDRRTGEQATKAAGGRATKVTGGRGTQAAGGRATEVADAASSSSRQRREREEGLGLAPVSGVKGGLERRHGFWRMVVGGEGGEGG